MRRISWFIYSKRYIIVSWCTWELSNYVPWNIWTRSWFFSYCIRISIQISMILMVEKGIRGRICHAICRYTKSNNKYMKHWHVNTLYGWARSQMLPANDFTGIEETSQFNEGFIKSIMMIVITDIFLKLMFNILKIYITFTMIYLPFLIESMTI